MNMRSSKSDIISRFKNKFGNEYDYSFVNYETIHTKIKIVCKIHGAFEKSPAKHLSGQGCPECKKIDKISKDQKLKQAELINEFKILYNGRFDYSKMHYQNSGTKIEVICNIHGSFMVLPLKHKKGIECPKCSKERTKNETDLALNNLINLFISKHGEKYDYSHVLFVNKTTPVKIKCKHHGIFEMTPSRHLSGRNCPLCAKNKKLTREEYLEKFRQIHANKYDYSKSVFLDSANIEIVCSIHGSFMQNPKKHLAGSGCKKCGILRASKSKIKDKLEVIEKFYLKHGKKYNYDKVEYVRSNSEIIVTCPFHGDFKITPSQHIRGTACPLCSSRQRYDTDKIITEFKKIHGNKYDYSKVLYTSAKSEIAIICKIHGVYLQSAFKHKSGQGCPICNRGWTNSKIREFISAIENKDLLSMDSIELQLIINQGKLPDALESLVFNSEGTREHSIKALKESLIDFVTEEPIEENEIFNEQTNSENIIKDIEIDDVENSDLINNDRISEIQENKTPISLSNNLDELHVLDNALVASCDIETVNFLIQYKLRKLWNNTLNEKVDVQKLRKVKGGRNFEILKDLFFKEYDEVISYEPPCGYSFKFPLLPMQQLTVYRVLKNKRYGNWSGTGAGKTISFIVTSRAVHSKLTVLIGLNSTINQLADAITEVYPDSKVFKHYEIGTVYDRRESNYLILNYDKFQQGYSEELFQDLTKNNTIDFVGIDEVHNVKQRSEEQESIRRGTLKRLVGRASENNPNLYLLGMSATPVINNLTEARSLLELITGKEYEDLNTTRTLTNALEVFKHMTLNGLRYMPKYDISIKELDGSNTSELKIDGSEILEKLLSFENNSYLETEQELLKLKLKAIEKYLCKGAIIYSYFTHKMILPIVEHLRNSGYKVATYTGEESMETRELNKEAFLKGQIDILVGSRPIGTGVDGLQKVCNRLIVLSLPWTDSEYTQLKGRIYRQGSKFNDVEIIIPQVYIPLEEREWSWDAQRLNLIRNKKTLADAAIDGLIPSKILPSPQTLYTKSIEALREWKQRISEGEIYTIVRKELKFPLNPEIVQQLSRKLGDFSEVNRIWSVSKSETTHDRLKKNPDEWYYYHTLYAEKRKEWDQIPYIEIAKMIKRKDFIVADLGCGENLLKLEIPDNKVLSFDHVSIDPTVASCDLANLPLDSEEVDVAVFSLALMGSNYETYLIEAHRILKPMGFMFIAEPLGKWEGKLEQLSSKIQNIGFTKPSIDQRGRFYYLKCEKN
ncbi:MAG: hypothetical protein RL070_639 [Bacteroidota bacterium]|jgi:superfamily II DNA or RNA helicase/Zn ribbon nucleic-acid-binding protein